MDQTVTKMVVETYADATYTARQKEFQVLFNPEKYTLGWAFNFDSKELLKGGSTTAVLESVTRSVFSMDFIFDGTGVGAAALDRKEVNVAREVWDFLETATVLNRKNKRKPSPPYCRLVWGNLCAKCLVQSVNMEVKLLDRSGKILRAVLKTTFQTVYPEE